MTPRDSRRRSSSGKLALPRRLGRPVHTQWSGVDGRRSNHIPVRSRLRRWAAPIATVFALTSVAIPMDVLVRDSAGADAHLPAASAAAGEHPARRGALLVKATVTLSPGPAAALPSDGKWHLLNIGGGRRLAITCQGTGAPAVVLEHGIGYGVDSGSWATVEKGVARTTRVCRYDRAFVGHSDDGASGRGLSDLAADLRALLKAAGIPSPYILVGHSFGGLTVRYYALAYPKDVVGMVQVDGSPPSVATTLDLSSERLSRTRVLSQLKKLSDLGKMPLVVLTRGIGLTVTWRAAQEDLLELSTRSRQVFATQSDHWIQLRQPDLVIAQVGTVIRTIRRWEETGS